MRILYSKPSPPGVPLRRRSKGRRSKLITAIAATGDWIEEGQEITLLKQETKPKKVFKLELEVVWEDDYLAVVNKPEGIPTSGNYFRTVENALPYNITPSTLIDALPYPLPVHRLDNPTSGLLIIAKTRTTQTILSRDLELKKIRKVYLALVQGHTPDDIIYSDALDGKPASTEIQLLRHLEIGGKPFSIIKALPATGRTHQIRKHLSLHAYPIAGDKEYGEGDEPGLSSGLFLTAIGLDFSHPVSGTSLSLEIAWPLKFRKL
jgi:RluA family pseudouridine synthase